MPVAFYIDVPLGVAFCRAHGSVDHAQMLDFRARLRRHPDFRPALKQLFDLRDVSEFKVSSAEIEEMASAKGFTVCREMKEALAWLELGEEPDPGRFGEAKPPAGGAPKMP